MAELRMPSLGADMEAGTLVAWRCAPGDLIRRGAIVAEVETDKGIIEVEAFDAGVVDELLISPGTRVPVGTALARLRDGAGAAEREPPLAEPAAPSPAVTPSPRPPPAPTAPAGRPIVPTATRPPAAAAPPIAAAATAPSVAPQDALARFPPSVRQRAREEGVDPWVVLARRHHITMSVAAPPAAGPPARTRVSPRARRRAEELALDPTGLVGTGLDGAITTEDVERAARGASRPAGDERAAMRRAIAASMERSNREIPHYYVVTTIDLSRVLAWVAAANAERSVDSRLVPAVLLLKATALALREIPELNATWQDGGLRPIDRIHLGVAVSLRGGGLVAPAIHDADRLDLDALMKALADVVARARQRRLRSSELADVTCTVTSLGDRGVETVMPLISPPQVAMVGFGKIAPAPIAVDDRVEVRPVVHATLAGDHRATDGHRGAAFLASLGALLQRPETL